METLYITYDYITNKIIKKFSLNVTKMLKK